MMPLRLSLFLLSAMTTIIAADPIYGEYEISMPRFRYVEWDDLDDDYQDLAREVGYDEESWDNLYTNEIESLSFSALETKEYLDRPRRVDADNPRSVLAQMGFTETVWDCWINHYGDYTWEELEEYDIDDDYEELGWSERRWENERAPESAELEWGDLSRRDRQAAANLCYLPETWDGEEMDDIEDDSEYLEDDDEPWIERYDEDDLIYSEWEVTMPRNRFIMWEDLSSDMRRIARSLGYTSASWERPYSHEIEFFSFDDLDDDDKLEGEDITASRPNSVLEDLGFIEETWDCWVNHYGGYSWDDLVEYDIAEAYETLGWDEDRWEGKGKGLPKSSEKYWKDLSDEEKQAAANVCYLPETWDEQEFDKFILRSEYIASTEPWNVLTNVGGFCFPGSAIVIIQGVGPAPMSQLKLGDTILVDTKGTYERVYSFGHYEPNKVSKKPSSLFTKITATNGSELILSPNHMVASVGRTIPATQVKKGDRLLHAFEGEVIVKSVRTIAEPHGGLYAPFTPSGYLVVNNIVASNYVSLQGTETLELPTKQKTSLSHQWIAHSANMPHRLYCSYISNCMKEKYTATGISRWVATPMAISEYVLNSDNVIISTLVLVIIIAMATGFTVLEFLLATPMISASSFIFLTLLFLCRFRYQYSK